MVSAATFIMANCVTVRAQQFAVLAGPVFFDPQVNLFKQIVRVTNLAAVTFPVRIYVDNMQAGVRDLECKWWDQQRQSLCAI